MERRNNYFLQAQSAKQRFLTYDQGLLIRRFFLNADERYLYMTMLRRQYRIDRATGDLEKQIEGSWVDGNSHGEVMTLYDVLCDARENRCLTGRWRSMQSFGLMFHSSLAENDRSSEAELFDREPERLRRNCLRLDGMPLPGADIGYAVELFDGFPVGVQFWHSDEEFAPRLRYLWDENALQYIRYETMWYAVGLLLERLREPLPEKEY